MDQGKSISILIDLSDVSTIDPSVLGISPKALRDGEFKKMAAFGVQNKADEDILNQIEKESGTVDKARIFKTRDEAIAWLKE